MRRHNNIYGKEQLTVLPGTSGCWLIQNMSTSGQGWMLVDSEYVNKRSREERFIFGVDATSTDVTARWCGRIVASGRVVPFVLIFTNWDQKIIPTLPDAEKVIIVREIPGLYMCSQLIARRLLCMLVFSEMVHQWKDSTGGTKMRFCTRHTILGKYYSPMDLLSASFEMK
jgi:hypothetical protein